LLTGESQSIANQKMLLEQFAEQNGFANPRHFSEIITTRLIQFNDSSTPSEESLKSMRGNVNPTPKNGHG
jgi:hypothetical protein